MSEPRDSECSADLQIGAAELGLLIRMAGMRVPEEDFVPLAKALERHVSHTRILLDAELTCQAPAFGARWHV